jgi:hypothetical protein
LPASTLAPWQNRCQWFEEEKKAYKLLVSAVAKNSLTLTV